MAIVIKSSEIGLRKGLRLCNMSSTDRLNFIAEGLPLIYQSAASLVGASQSLHAHTREAAILAGQAEEECAKLLILIDIVRCPQSQLASRIGPMMRWFYDHLARLIYADAQAWCPTDAAQLQSYIDDQRRSHYLEGEYGEFIMPNWTLFRRETSLYTDIARSEDGELQWIAPLKGDPGFPAMIPISFQVVDALAAFGVFTLSGLKILSDVWGRILVTPSTPWSITRDNYLPLAEKLHAAGLISERTSEDHAGILAHRWQMPMYGMDFAPIPVELDELQQERDSFLPYL